MFMCSVCGHGVMAHVTDEPTGTPNKRRINKVTYPPVQEVSEDLPASAKTYLQQAVSMRSAPDGAALLAAAAIDAMLKARGLIEGSLNSRIKEAESTHLVTSEMAAWAHEVRLGSNEVRHADVEQPHRTQAEAQRLVDFAVALGEFLFTLPAKVARGRVPPPDKLRLENVSKAPPPIEPVR